ncbi:MAG: hydrogenase maturation protease [Azonexus sp.]
MTAPLVVFAVGNPSRGDDAIGPVICGRLEEWLENEKLADRVELIEDFQLNVEHALDLQSRELALFIDAGENTPAPFIFAQIFPSTVPSHTTHALPPQAVLQVYRQMERSDPPPSFVLCVRGEKFELGEPLTAAAENHATLAFELLIGLCRQPMLAKWEAAATSIEQLSINSRPLET